MERAAAFAVAEFVCQHQLQIGRTAIRIDELRRLAGAGLAARR
jgi:hypothetical protein